MQTIGTIAVAGAIGVGKSTVCRELVKLTKGMSRTGSAGAPKNPTTEFLFVDENVDGDTECSEALTRSYAGLAADASDELAKANKSTAAFQFQVYMMTRQIDRYINGLEIAAKMLEDNPDLERVYVVVERSILDGLDVFMELNETDDFAKKLYRDLARRFRWHPELVVVIDTFSADVCWDRCVARARAAEKKMSETFVRDIHAAYRRVVRESLWDLETTRTVSLLNDGNPVCIANQLLDIITCHFEDESVRMHPLSVWKGLLGKMYEVHRPRPITPQVSDCTVPIADPLIVKTSGRRLSPFAMLSSPRPASTSDESLAADEPDTKESTSDDSMATDKLDTKE